MTGFDMQIVLDAGEDLGVVGREVRVDLVALRPLADQSRHRIDPLRRHAGAGEEGIHLLLLALQVTVLPAPDLDAVGDVLAQTDRRPLVQGVQAHDGEDLGLAHTAVGCLDLAAQVLLLADALARPEKMPKPRSGCLGQSLHGSLASLLAQVIGRYADRMVPSSPSDRAVGEARSGPA